MCQKSQVLTSADWPADKGVNLEKAMVHGVLATGPGVMYNAGI